MAKGVAASRITATGFGMSKPVADNSTAEGRQANRRTSIVVLGESVENIGGTSLGIACPRGWASFSRALQVMNKVVIPTPRTERRHDGFEARHHGACLVPAVCVVVSGVGVDDRRAAGSAPDAPEAVDTIDPDTSSSAQTLPAEKPGCASTGSASSPRLS